MRLSVLRSSGLQEVLRPRFWSQLIPVPARCCLVIGDRTPEFRLSDAEGSTIQLSDYLGKPIVLVFVRLVARQQYSETNCAYVRSLNAASAQFAGLGATVLLIAKISSEEAAQVSQSLSLNIPLLADPGGRVFNQYGVGQALGLPLPAQFVLNREGQLYFQHLFSVAHTRATPERLLWAVRNV